MRCPAKPAQVVGARADKVGFARPQRVVPRIRGRVLLPVLILLALAVAGAVYYLAPDYEVPVGAVPGESGPAAPPRERGPVVRHPVPEDAAGQPAAGRLAPRLSEPLPELEDSDAALRELVGKVFAYPELSALLMPRDIIRRIVVTVDNLPKRSLPPKHLPLRHPPGEFLAARRGDRFVIDTANYRRYDRYVALLEEFDGREVVAAYSHFYPLFQQAYRELGYASGYFNDRLIVAIDDLMETPSVEPPVELKHPSVRYIYADEDLEALSAGQRLLLRMGPDNAARVKRVLNGLRDALLP